MTLISARRQRLASFENAYAVAIQMRQHTGIDQYVIHTGDPIQPFRVTKTVPSAPDTVYAMVA